MFTAILTLDHNARVFLLSVACNNFFPGSRAHFSWGHYQLSFTLGGQSHLGAFAFILGAPETPQETMSLDDKLLLTLRKYFDLFS